MDLSSKMYTPWSLIIPNIRDESWVEWIKAIEYYKQRILTMFNENDHAIMPQVTKKYNDIISDIYRELGIPFIDKNNIIYVDYDSSISSCILDEYERLKLDSNIDSIYPFIHSSKIDTISRIFDLNISRTSHSSEIINDKSVAQNELNSLWVTTPHWKSVYTYNQAESFFRELKWYWYEHVTFKLKRAASWMWVFKIKTLNELIDKLNEYENDLKDGILIDGWIEWKFISSPNVQYHIWKTPAEDVYIWSSSQILSEDWTVHLWNITDDSFLKDKKVQKDLRIICDWVRSKKAYWIIGIDFSIFEDKLTKEKKAYFMEINWRINWSTHWAVIASKIYGHNYNDNWAVINNLYLDKKISINDFVTKLQRDGIYYDPSKKQWIIPSNISAIDNYSKAMVTVFWDKAFIKKSLNILNDYNNF